MIDKPLPIVQGDWVATTQHDYRTQIGRVRYAWWEGDEVLMNVVLYAPDGTKLGRSSPAVGGPRGFEPALTFDGEWWRRIEAPNFPLTFRHTSIPSAKPGFRTLIGTYQSLAPGDPGLTTKPVRTTVKVQSRDRVRRKPWEAPRPERQVDGEIASLRRAAQELRDTARRLTGIDGSGSTLLARAKELEAEAEALA